MPAIPNPKHELFAQGLMSGLSAAAAYVAAGYVSNDGNAIRLKGNERVVKRLVELRATAEAKGLLTLEEHMTELKSLRDLAKKNNQTSAAVAAEVKRGELMGYYIERSENINRNYVVSDKPMSQDDWETKYCLAAAGGTPASTH